METEFLTNSFSNEYRNDATETTLLDVRFLATFYFMYKIGKKIHVHNFYWKAQEARILRQCKIYCQNRIIFTSYVLRNIFGCIFAGDVLNKYYFLLLVPAGVIGNALSFMVG